MKSRLYEWRLRFAPYGYQWIERTIALAQLHTIYCARDYIFLVIDQMMNELQVDEVTLMKRCHTFVHPMEVGESLDRHDPLKPRWAIRIEIRLPLYQGERPGNF